eukprot:2639191-Amphidinium_carterae.1
MNNLPPLSSRLTREQCNNSSVGRALASARVLFKANAHVQNPLYKQMDAGSCNQISSHWRLFCDGSFSDRGCGWGFCAIPPNTPADT